jgi:hypothetical protein
MAERTPTNRHPADRLSDVHAQIKALEAEEARLRDWLLAHPDDRQGFDYAAAISSRSQRRIDPEALRRYVSAEVIARCMVTSTITYVRTRERERV